MNTSTSFGEQKSTSPQRNVSNFNTDRHLRIRLHTLHYSSMRHSTTVYEPLRLEGIRWSSAWFVERKFTSPCSSVSNSHPDTPTHVYLHIYYHTTGFEHLYLNRHDIQHFHFICRAEVNIATEKRLQFRHDTDTYSTIHHWHWEAAYGNQRRSSWLEQYLRYSTQQVLQVDISISIQYRSRFNRTGSPSEELFTGSQDSWTWQRYRLPSLRISHN